MTDSSLPASGQTSTLPRGTAVRAASAADLAAAARVYVIAADAPDKTEIALQDLALLQAEHPRQVLVSEQDGRVVGMAAAAFRERHWHLVYLYVLPEAQGRGLGTALLDALMAAGREAGCRVFTTESSGDPRAMTAYLRAGMMPAPPLLQMIATAPRFPPLRWQDGLEARPFTPDDDTLIATATDIDRAIRGAPRERDLRRWIAEGATGAVLFRHDSAIPAGYYLVQTTSPQGHAVIGPVAPLDAERTGDVTARALAAAGEAHLPGLVWRAIAPGQNRAAIDALLAAGFRATRFSRFLTSGPLGIWDRYLAHDLDLL